MSRRIECCNVVLNMNMRRSFMRLVFGALLTLSVVACALPAPERSTDGWSTASPAAAGLDSSLLRQAVGLVDDGTYQNIHGIVIVKDGSLVFEHYWPGYRWDYYGQDFKGAYAEFGRDSPHNTASVTKSITSALVGIAIDQGYILDVNQKLFDLLPEYSDLRNADNQDITLEDLLTMTAGFAWNGLEVPINTRDPRNDVLQLFAAPDPLAYVLGKPMVASPGSTWYYNAGETVLLGEVIRRVSGMPMDEFAARYLFDPLGITEHEWFLLNPETVYAAGNLQLRPRDMAKFGYLYLNGGRWQGQTVISESWIAASTQPHVATLWRAKYGYQWWVSLFDSGSRSYLAYYADGWGGQRIFVLPDLAMVVVFTGGNYVQTAPVDEILQQYILPAAES